MLKLRKEFADHISDGHPFVSDVPTGAIVAWFSNDIPDGWALCDGTAGTSDFRNYVFIGAPVSFCIGDLFTKNLNNGVDFSLKFAYCNWIMKT
jgi:hypothetical protein